MNLKCVNRKCLHEWNYKGNIIVDKDLISCPKCHYRNPLGKLKLLKILTHSSEYRKVIETPKTETIHKEDLPELPKENLPSNKLAKNIGEVDMFDGKVPIRNELPELPGKELSYDELPSEIGGVKIKNV